jgi:hypothetical protein
VSTVICIASGPSLTPSDVDLCRGYEVIACNMSYQLCPWAAHMIAVDFGWWREFHKDAFFAFRGRKWTTSTRARDDYGLEYMEHSAAQGLSKQYGIINGGGNTGQAAVNLAYHLGAKRIILLGYDMQRTDKKSHWHGDYRTRPNGNAFGLWIPRLMRMVNHLSQEGIEVVNATRQTALTAIPRITIEEALHVE